MPEWNHFVLGPAGDPLTPRVRKSDTGGVYKQIQALDWASQFYPQSKGQTEWLNPDSESCGFASI